MKLSLAPSFLLCLALAGGATVHGDDGARSPHPAESGTSAPGVLAQLAPPRAQQSNPAGAVDVAEFGAVGNGSTDDTASLQRALNSGRLIILAPGRSYAVTSPLKVPANGGIVSDGTGEIFARASGFTNTDPTAAGRYRPTSTVIDASGMTTAPYTPNRNVTFRAFRLRFESTEGRSVDGIMARNVDGLVIDGVEISGFPAGAGIRLSSIVGQSAISNNRIRDFSSNTDFSKAYPGGRGQITGIEIDNDRINGDSRNIVISNNQITNLTVGPVFLAAHGYETDGINIHAGTGHRVEGNRISTIGEGIDTYASSGTIINNVVTDSYIFGIKLIHGASGNTVTGNTVRRSGLAGIIVSGSADASQGTEKNTISNNTITEIDPNGAWAKSTTSCIQISDNRGTIHKARNNVFSGNILDPGKNGKWVINLAANTGENNSFPNNKLVRSGTRGWVVERAGARTTPP